MQLSQLMKNNLETATAEELNAVGTNILSQVGSALKDVPSKLFAQRNDDNIKCHVITDNPEYVYAVVDSNNVFLFGVKADGSVEWAKGIPSPIKKELSTKISSIENEISLKVDKVEGKGLVNSVFADAQESKENDEFSEVKTDSNNRLIHAVNAEGKEEFFTAPIFHKGFEIPRNKLDEVVSMLHSVRNNGDWTDSKSAHIPEPKCAIVNFFGTESIPMVKGDIRNCFMEFWDCQGNYFKKKVSMDAQGNSTLDYPKHNAAIDIFNDDWDGDSFKLKIGNWVEQDSFHFKAFWVDAFSGAVGQAMYDLLDDIWKDRGFSNDAPWKKALVKGGLNGYEFGAVTDPSLRIDTGARNHPLGFPCVVYINGIFHGVYAFALKKHRDNYHLEKKNKKHIHIDGEIASLWSGAIDWTKVEIRNPSGLKDVDGNAYDKDNPKELSDTDANSVFVKGKVVALSSVMGELESCKNTYGINSNEFKNLFESHFDVDNFIDYIIFSEIILDTDTGVNNVQWVTYDGDKWWACPYDLDRCCGNWYGYFNRYIAGHFAATSSTPFKYITQRTEYLNALQSRYAELRVNGILSVKNIFGHIHGWVEKVGFENLKADWEKWPTKPCNTDPVVDSHWEMVIVDGSPVYGESSTYNSATTYNLNDEVFYGMTWGIFPNPLNDFVKFRCVSQCVGKAPCTYIGSRDSEWRLYAFVEYHLNYMDNIYNYNQE